VPLNRAFDPPFRVLRTFRLTAVYVGLDPLQLPTFGESWPTAQSEIGISRRTSVSSNSIGPTEVNYTVSKNVSLFTFTITLSDVADFHNSFTG